MKRIPHRLIQMKRRTETPKKMISQKSRLFLRLIANGRLIKDTRHDTQRKKKSSMKALLASYDNAGGGLKPFLEVEAGPEVEVSSF